MDGWIILDKDSGLFSRTAGARVARMFGTRHFGHIGTLDPMASGVLPIAIGNATKTIPFVEETRTKIKEYEFSMLFGTATDTIDITGNTIQTNNIIPTQTDIANAVNHLVGDIMQTPPMFSAVHVNGIRAYDAARVGKTMNIPARPVTVYNLDIIANHGARVDLRMRCSRGTYVRAIVRDIAQICGAIATTTSIRRTETIGCNVKTAIKLDFLENVFNNGGALDKYLMPSDWLLGDIPVVNLDAKSAELFCNGGFIQTATHDGMVRVYHDKFIGIGNVSDCILRPKRII